MKEIIIASKNEGKIKEFKKLFEIYHVEVKSLLDFTHSFEDIEETGTTFEENARIKAETIRDLLNKPVIADDSGLAVDALEGRPGVYSARYSGEPKDDTRNNSKLLRELADTAERSAQFVCVLAIAIPEKETLFSKGICRGAIAMKLSGDTGFGYDPLFIPAGYQQTMAELGADIKNKISHRFHALQSMEQLLNKLNLIGDQS